MAPATRRRFLPVVPGPRVRLADQRVALSGEKQSIVAPPGVRRCADQPSRNQRAFGRASSVAGYALGVLPGQSARFTSEPLATPLTLIGSSRIDLDVTGTTSSATLFASLWDLGPDIESTENGRSTVSPSSAVLPQLEVAPVKLDGLDPNQPLRVRVALPAVSHKVPVGHRLQLVITTTDQAYANAVPAARYDDVGRRPRRRDSGTDHNGTEREHSERASSAADCGSGLGCVTCCCAGAGVAAARSRRFLSWPMCRWS